MRPDEKITQVIKNIVEVASLPSVVQKLLEILRKDGTPEALSEVIATDLGLTAKVLRLVNCSFYSPSVPIASVAEAGALLGIPTLKSILLSASAVDVVDGRCEGFDSTQSWRHSLAVAMACKRLAQSFFGEGQDDLYVAGLLHDAGVVVMAQHCPDEYSEVLHAARDSGRSLEEAEREVFGISHADVGYMLATRWRLPNMLCKCIRGHEDEYTSLGTSLTVEVDKRTEQWRCVDVVRFANRWAIHRGIGIVGTPCAGEIPFPEPPAWFAIEKENWVEVLQRVEEEFEAISKAICPEMELASSAPLV